MTSGSNRKQITSALTLAASYYLSHKTYGVVNEIGLQRWGKRRADVLGVNKKGHLVLIEVKSCKQDFITDKKWQIYSGYADKCYFIVTEESYQTWMQEYLPEIRKNGWGVLILHKTTGYACCKINARNTPVIKGERKKIIINIAWRNAAISKRTTNRRRIYIE